VVDTQKAKIFYQEINRFSKDI